MKKAIGGLILTGLLTLGVATSGAHAEVIFDSATGTGFVGKGDVQLALNYNNAKMQENAANLTFTSTSTNVYDVTVEWDTGLGTKGQKHHLITETTTNSFKDNVSYDTKTKKQVVGFNLTGITSHVTSGDVVPAIGDQMNDSDKITKIVTNVELVSHTDSGLLVNGISLTPAPVAIITQ